MADPTGTLSRSFKEDVNRMEGAIKSAEALVIGGLIAWNYNTGKVEFMDDSQYLIPMGVAIKQKDGDNENLTGDASGTYSVIGRAGMVLENVSITGASGITDTFKWVYATDGQVLTLTRPTTGMPIGFVKKWRATTYCDVQLLSIEGARLLSSIGTKQTIRIGEVSSSSLEGTSAADLVELVLPFACTIDSFYARCSDFDAGLVAGDQDLNLEIDGTDVTGGVLTLGFGNADAIEDLGDKISATAITAANTCKTGSTLQVELAASGTGFTASKVGRFELFMDVTPIPGA